MSMEIHLDSQAKIELAPISVSSSKKHLIHEYLSDENNNTA